MEVPGGITASADGGVTLRITILPASTRLGKPSDVKDTGRMVIRWQQLFRGHMRAGATRDRAAIICRTITLPPPGMPAGERAGRLAVTSARASATFTYVDQKRWIEANGLRPHRTRDRLRDGFRRERQRVMAALVARTLKARFPRRTIAPIRRTSQRPSLRKDCRGKSIIPALYRRLMMLSRWRRGSYETASTICGKLIVWGTPNDGNAGCISGVRMDVGDLRR